MKKLEKNISYQNTGNIFSISLLLKHQLQYFKKFLVVVGSEKEAENYKKIFDFLGTPIQILENTEQLARACFSQTSHYIIEIDVLENITLSEYNLQNTESFSLSKGETIGQEDILHKLVDFGYHFSDFEKERCYKKSGDIITIWGKNEEKYTLSFWGDSIENIFDAKGTEQEEVIFGKLTSLKGEFLPTNNKETAKHKLLQENFTLLNHIDFHPNYSALVDECEAFASFDFIDTPNRQNHNLEHISLKIKDINELKELLEGVQGREFFVYTKNIDIIKNFVEYNNIHKNITFVYSDINILKSFENKKEIFICDDILSKIFIKKRIRRSVSSNMDLLLEIKEGNYIVHIEHGIGVFQGVIKKQLGETEHEYLEIHYKNNDKLFVPITEAHRITKYVGIENPPLTGLNTKEWTKKMKKAGEEAEEIAQELLETFAQRKLEKGFSFQPFPEKEAVFQENFPYSYTLDQDKSISEILQDMEGEHNMDRLLCGDVGFGKTEVAFNAIYRAFLNNKQSVLISPLVVLAYEQYDKAIERFRQFGLKIAVLTRFETQKKVTQVMQKMASGELDLLVGTHKLLSEKNIFKNLGLVIIDEEHKFGVTDKDKIKRIKSKVDYLSMSATPIPRSLNLALSSVKKMSILHTAPMGRKNIETSVSRFSESIIFEACQKEFARDGQVFFIHNRVAQIENYKKVLEKLFPEKKIGMIHGQLSGDTIEATILDFKYKKFDILLSTTIIENGVDFANVNTIIINEADRFGISQIHQLRGRVGRRDKKGYCQLLYRKEKLKDTSIQKLKTLVEYSHLGAGFELAMKDLEIRGAGDILGRRQSGQKTDIGVNLFLRILEKKIKEIRTGSKKEESSTVDKTPLLEAKSDNIDCKIDVPLSAYLDDTYFQGESDKINFYKEVESLDSLQELEEIQQSFIDIHSPLSKNSQNFFLLLKIKFLARNYGIIGIKTVGLNYQIDFKENITLDELKVFLKLDKEVFFYIVSVNRLRAQKKSFSSHEDFVRSLEVLFTGKGTPGGKKIKLKKKVGKNL